MGYRIEIDKTWCIGNGDCADIAPKVFRVGTISEVIGTDTDDVIFEAARSCPARAITVIDDKTGAEISTD